MENRRSTSTAGSGGNLEIAAESGVRAAFGMAIVSALRRWVVVPIFALAGVLLLRGYPRELGFFEDDAAYYFVIAEHLLHGGRSTFDGLTTTTGYHPLWLALNVLLLWISGDNRPVFVIELIALCVVLAVSHAAIMQRLLARLSSPTVVDVVVLVVVTRSLNIGFNGMESAVAMPVLAGCALETLNRLEARISAPRDMMWLGLLAATAGLSRLDALPFGLACGALVLWRQRSGPKDTLAQAAFFGLGLLPFVAYLVGNWLLTGSPLTTSASAKSLGSGFAWNAQIFSNLSKGDRLCFVSVSLLGALLICSRWAPWRGVRRDLAMVIVGFPIAYYSLLALRSSWQIWSWYMYPLPLSTGVALVAFAEVAKRRVAVLARLGRGWAVPVALGISLLMIIKIYRSRGNNEGVLQAALALAHFSGSHPGRYGMGDRAGLTAFLGSQPIVQLEGLVCDRALLKAIREQRDLHRTLVGYNVDYLVEALPTGAVDESRCQYFSEPKLTQSGAHSPKMRGRFCDPLFRVDTVDSHSTFVYAVPR